MGTKYIYIYFLYICNIYIYTLDINDFHECIDMNHIYPFDDFHISAPGACDVALGP